ncbi:pyruvate, phosphate dikinase [Flavobacterium saccharophilum]|uniref:Pyruvate, phosphate dikinase n=1 Tax=Flavobacterium saccharophilum TaxID=29534 RepID=A0A1M7FUL0_9FLAO|nr:pyruvate, phosphate dikinase [Flavobacterium saccharophilum]SHM07329.1 pyruvate phosphate dikinase [Flavobacterium saccharophilum]
MTDTKKTVYTFGSKKAQGNAQMKDLLGGKGANLCEMNLLGMPVPPGFTISTEMCALYSAGGRSIVLNRIKDEVQTAITEMESQMGNLFGSNTEPLLVSVRSGSRASMPGMMDTILNLGLNDKSAEGLANKTGNPRFVWDSYRRFIQMYSEVVLHIKPLNREAKNPFEEIIEELKKVKNIKLDNEFTAEDLKEIVYLFKSMVKKVSGTDFPSDPWEQLWGAITAVFDSWMNERAVYYRQLNNIPEDWGTAVNVQAMVFGNMGINSATGVAFTRDASTGENIFNGEYLINAQGEDVVAGIRTPQQISLEGSKRWATSAGVSEDERFEKFPSLEETMPKIFKELQDIGLRLEEHYRDMQDIEFTIQEGQLWMLQTRNGKRTGAAMVKMSVEMFEEGILTEKEALLRVQPERLDELLHPVFEKNNLEKAVVLGQGLPASPGAASGQIVFFAEDAVKWAEEGKTVVLVRLETSPEDLKGMVAAQGILTARGGMTSHAAVVARGMGKCCVSGAESFRINYKTRTLKCGDIELKEGDWISLDGSTGKIYKGQITTTAATLSGDFDALMNMTDNHATMKVRTNADTPQDAEAARRFGAQGIGLCRTEHMFFEGDKIKAVREMILAEDKVGRNAALAKLLPMQRQDLEGILWAMEGLPVTIRLLDPPLHEFVPHEEASQKEMAEEMDISVAVLQEKIRTMHESNPMLGHRGCRLGNTYPEISEMQTRAIIEAALNLKKAAIKTFPEIMIPLTGTPAEMEMQKKIVNKTAEQVFREYGQRIDYKVGTMIEVPRAALVADKIARSAEFFSFGTNDLTQMTFGYSRDDTGKFLPFYLENGILENDPFQVLDQKGVGQLMKMAAAKGLSERPDLKLGICGEHGGDPSSIEFCHSIGIDYVSCSPFRVPIARLAAAQAAIKNHKQIESESFNSQPELLEI